MQHSALPRPQIQPRTTVSLTVFLTSREGSDSRLSNLRSVASANPHHKRRHIRAHAGSWSVVMKCLMTEHRWEDNRFCLEILTCVSMEDHMLESDLSTSTCSNLIVDTKNLTRALIHATTPHITSISLFVHPLEKIETAEITQFTKYFLNITLHFTLDITLHITLHITFHITPHLTQHIIPYLEPLFARPCFTSIVVAACVYLRHRYFTSFHLAHSALCEHQQPQSLESRSTLFCWLHSAWRRNRPLAKLTCSRFARRLRNWGGLTRCWLHPM